MSSLRYETSHKVVTLLTRYCSVARRLASEFECTGCPDEPVISRADELQKAAENENTPCFMAV
jgi:hypothetical protein